MYWFVKIGAKYELLWGLPVTMFPLGKHNTPHTGAVWPDSTLMHLPPRQIRAVLFIEINISKGWFIVGKTYLSTDPETMSKLGIMEKHKTASSCPNMVIFAAYVDSILGLSIRSVMERCHQNSRHSSAPPRQSSLCGQSQLSHWRRCLVAVHELCSGRSKTPRHDGYDPTVSDRTNELTFTNEIL